MVLTGTDAQIVRPYKGLHVPSVPTAVTRPMPSDPSDTSDSSDQGNHPFPREKFLNLHRGTKEFFGLMISFFRSFISFFRTFISPLREEIPFCTELSGISSGDVQPLYGRTTMRPYSDYTSRASARRLRRGIACRLSERCIALTVVLSSRRAHRIELCRSVRPEPCRETAPYLRHNPRR